MARPAELEALILRYHHVEQRRSGSTARHLPPSCQSATASACSGSPPARSFGHGPQIEKPAQLADLVDRKVPVHARCGMNRLLEQAGAACQMLHAPADERGEQLGAMDLGELNGLERRRA